MAYREESFRDNNRDQVGWNLLDTQTKIITNLLNKSMNSYLAGDIGKWYWGFTGIREAINHDLETKEAEKLDKMEKECNVLHNKWISWKRAKDEGHEHVRYDGSKAEFSKKVRAYSRIIRDLLKAQGYFPPKEDRTQLSF